MSTNEKPGWQGLWASDPPKRELAVFLFLAFVLIPILTVAAVGGFGFSIWMYQLVAGPPTG